MKKLMKLSTFRDRYFAKGDAPTVSTLRRLIDSREVAGIKLGGQYYVDTSKFEAPTNELVESVLKAS